MVSDFKGLGLGRGGLGLEWSGLGVGLGLEWWGLGLGLGLGLWGRDSITAARLQQSYVVAEIVILLCKKKKSIKNVEKQEWNQNCEIPDWNDKQHLNCHISTTN